MDQDIDTVVSKLVELYRASSPRMPNPSLRGA